MWKKVLTVSHGSAILMMLTDSHQCKVKEGVNLTNGEKLANRISECGFTKVDFALKMGITRQGLAKKIKNQSEFKQSEIEKARKLLKLNSKLEKEIFFASNVD